MVAIARNGTVASHAQQQQMTKKKICGFDFFLIWFILNLAIIAHNFDGHCFQNVRKISVRYFSQLSSTTGRIFELFLKYTVNARDTRGYITRLINHPDRCAQWLLSSCCCLVGTRDRTVIFYLYGIYIL